MIESTRRLLLGSDFSEKFNKLNTKVFSKKVMFNTMLAVMRKTSLEFYSSKNKAISYVSTNDIHRVLVDCVSKDKISVKQFLN